jgi:hypothetical protein
MGNQNTSVNSYIMVFLQSKFAVLIVFSGLYKKFQAQNLALLEKNPGALGSMSRKHRHFYKLYRYTLTHLLILSPFSLTLIPTSLTPIPTSLSHSLTRGKHSKCAVKYC